MYLLMGFYFFFTHIYTAVCSPPHWTYVTESKSSLVVQTIPNLTVITLALSMSPVPLRIKESYLDLKLKIDNVLEHRQNFTEDVN